MKDKHKRTFQKYASELIDDFPSVKDVVLFGSVAREEHGVNSDVDVLITVTELSEREDIENLAYEITAETGVSISPLIVKDSEEKKDILRTIAKEGKKYVRG